MLENNDLIVETESNMANIAPLADGIMLMSWTGTVAKVEIVKNERWL